MRQLLLLVFILVFGAGSAAIDGKNIENCTSHITEINAKKLKHWIDKKKQMVILDARTKEYDDGRRIPGAIFMPFNSDEKLLLECIPDYNSAVVCYCWNTKCPASGWLAERLESMGYTQIFEFPGGLVEWTEAGYPVETVTQ